jgi:hypothetical protein
MKAGARWIEAPSDRRVARALLEARASLRRIRHADDDDPGPRIVALGHRLGVHPFHRALIAYIADTDNTTGQASPRK